MLANQTLFHRFVCPPSPALVIYHSVYAILVCMLQLINSLLNQPVRSLRTGEVIATTKTPILNPNNLQIIGFYCQDLMERKQAILLEQDIRDIIPQGLVVNDYEVLCEPLELVKYKDILEINFDLFGKLVITEDKQKLGKVSDYATNTDTFYVHKLYVTKSLLRSLGSDQLSIDRSQIIEITDKNIIVKNPLQPEKSSPAIAPAL